MKTWRKLRKLGKTMKTFGKKTVVHIFRRWFAPRKHLILQLEEQTLQFDSYQKCRNFLGASILSRRHSYNPSHNHNNKCDSTELKKSKYTGPETNK